MKEKQQIRQRY